VTRGPIHSLFERLFGETDGKRSDAIDAGVAAHLAAAVDQQQDSRHGELSDTPERSVAMTAAYIDGGLDKAAQQDIHVHLSRSPEALHEVVGADAFVKAVEESKEAAPTDLVASVIARSRPTTVLTLKPRRTVAFWKWSGAALALAAAIATLVIVYRQTLPTDSNAPITAKSAPGQVTAPESPKIVQPLAPQGNAVPPAVAGKEEAKPKMAPAGNEATVPSSDQPKPAMAPEGFDTMPGSTAPHH
jgi:hypothetical protein